MRVDLFLARSEEGSKIKFERKQPGVVKGGDSHLAERNLTPSQAKKLYEAARDAFDAKAAEFAK
jgi:hypothetical protein